MSLDVVFTVSTFFDSLEWPEISSARSLTIEIDLHLLRLPNPDYSSNEPLASTKQLWDHLRALTQRIQSDSKFESFSFIVTKSGANGIWIPRPLLASLLTALPQTCVNVEIDTGSEDSGHPGVGHLCDAIRAVLPRLHHLRLRFRTMCHAMFGTGPSPQDADGNGQASYSPVSAAALQTVIVSATGRHYRNPSCLCGPYPDEEYHLETMLERTAIPTIGRCMQLMAPSCPSITRMWLLDMNPDRYGDFSIYPTFNRRDALQNSLYCMPWNWINTDKDGKLLRTNDGDFTSSLEGFQAYVEDRTWRCTTEGSRLPAPVLAEWGCSAVEEPALLTREEWQAKSRYSCHVWGNEKLSGERVLEPVQMTGMLENIVVQERTPEGWVREHYGGAMLCRPEDQGEEIIWDDVSRHY